MAAISPDTAGAAVHAKYASLDVSVPVIPIDLHSKYVGFGISQGFSTVEFPNAQLAFNQYLTNSAPYVAPTAFVVPMGRRRVGNRITSLGVIMQMRSPATGILDVFDLWLSAPNASATAMIFNLLVEGVSVWSGGSRPTFAAGIQHITKTDLGFEILKGERVELHVQQMPVDGIAVPIDMLGQITVE